MPGKGIFSYAACLLGKAVAFVLAKACSRAGVWSGELCVGNLLP